MQQFSSLDDDDDGIVGMLVDAGLLSSPAGLLTPSVPTFPFTSHTHSQTFSREPLMAVTQKCLAVLPSWAQWTAVNNCIFFGNHPADMCFPADVTCHLGRFCW